MNACAPGSDWLTANQHALAASLARLRPVLAGKPALAAPDITGSALDRLCRLLSLSPFERDLLLLCAGPELDSGFGSAVTAAQADHCRGLPSLGLALAVLPDAHWSALLPDAGLRHWGLLEVEAGSLTAAPVRVPETVLHALAGLPCLDARLTAVAIAVAAPEALPPSHQAVLERLAGCWRAGSGTLVQLCGPGNAGLAGIGAAAAAGFGLQAHRVASGALMGAEGAGWLRIWRRDAMLTGAALLVEGAIGAELAPALERLETPVLLLHDQPLSLPGATVLRIDVDRPTAAEQAALWTEALGPAISARPLVAAFDLGAAAIQAAAASAATLTGPAKLARMWAECRTQARGPLDGLARRILPKAGWDDLVLPAAAMATLHEIAAQIRHRDQVLRGWGMGETMRSGLGVGVLLAGPSGTGKSFAAEVLAGSLELDLYAVDLSGVMSKWLGETEANLRRIFDAAEAGGAALLFDEADALFGMRSEVKDSHDRYANLGVSYLLQRMEAYRGLAVLTTNMKESVDRAFLRRLRFVIDVPHPDAADRARIWRRMFPAGVPLDGVDFDRLAQLNLPGGNIRGIALNAAFRAAAEGVGVGMAHLLAATRAECAKLGRPAGPAEVQGWL